MFWKQFTPPVSELDNLLAKDECTLTEVLDAEDVLQECKGINNKLLKFLTRQDNIEELVSLVTSEPLDDVDETERFKHPNTACNILTSGAGTLMDKLISEEPLLDKLFEFMQNERPLNSLLASFFSRVVVELFCKKAAHMLEYLTSKEGLLETLLSHVDTSAIMDLILGICGAFQSVEEREELCQWMREHEVVFKLVDIITAREEAEKQRNASRILSDLHRAGYDFLSMNYDSMNQDDLVVSLESDETIKRLLTNVLADPTQASPFCHGLEFLCSMVTQQQQGTQTGGILAETVQYPNITNEEAASRVAECTSPFLPSLIEALRNPPAIAPLRTSVGEIVAPLGAGRLAIIRLLTALLHVNCTHYEEEVARLNVGAALLDLFFANHWNNFLHSYVQQFVAFALDAALGVQPQSGVELRRSLVVDGRLLQQLGKAAMENERDQIARQRRRGYMGHIVEVSNCVVGAQSTLEDLRDCVAELDADSLLEWNEWVDGPLEEVNTKNGMVLGGSIPSMSLHSSEEPMEPPEQQLPITDAFHHYNTQPMATEFADRFGFDDEDFTEFEESENASYQHGVDVDFSAAASLEESSASLFEQACSERMRRYSSDEEDSDGEEGSSQFGSQTWEERVPTLSSPLQNGVVESSSSSESDHEDKDDPEPAGDGTAMQTTAHNESSSSTDDEELQNPLRRITQDASHRGDDFSGNSIVGIPQQWSANFSAPTARGGGNSWEVADSSQNRLTSWANFDSAFGATAEGETANDQAPLVGENVTVGVPTPSAATTTTAAAPGDSMDADERSSGSSAEVSSDDDSDESDERDGSYSFGHLSGESDDDDEVSAGESRTGDDDSSEDLDLRAGAAPLDGDIADALASSAPSPHAADQAPDSPSKPTEGTTTTTTTESPAESPAESSSGDVAGAPSEDGEAMQE